MTRKATRVRIAKTKQKAHLEEWLAILASPLTQVAIRQSSKELGDICQKIRTRLISEGYTLVDGKFVPPTKDQE